MAHFNTRIKVVIKVTAAALLVDRAGGLVESGFVRGDCGSMRDVEGLFVGFGVGALLSGWYRYHFGGI